MPAAEGVPQAVDHADTGSNRLVKEFRVWRTGVRASWRQPLRRLHFLAELGQLCSSDVSPQLGELFGFFIVGVMPQFRLQLLDAWHEGRIRGVEPFDLL